ncbi:hypothetical protein DNTS_033744 [Danionella cerebrum]|uniref:Uncharacterized protein n=1 Tax=Danionella cerebrum TaxID=2873325 RepID=A0A553R2F9_9TELE|nr:hypothetical protein DNTS_033744 [Danionella translucida]
MTTVAAEFEHMDIQQQYQDSVNNRWDDDWDNENSSARLFERSRIKALAAECRGQCSADDHLVRVSVEDVVPLMMKLRRCEICFGSKLFCLIDGTDGKKDSKLQGSVSQSSENPGIPRSQSTYHTNAEHVLRCTGANPLLTPPRKGK